MMYNHESYIYIHIHECVASLVSICLSLFATLTITFMLQQECKRDGSGNACKEIKQKQKEIGSKTEMSQMTIISTPKTSNE